MKSHDDTTSSDVANKSPNDDGAHPYQRYHLFLSGIYVFVCAYRSFLPRIDLERYCLFDTRLSSIFLGRLSATIAEVSFSAQIALYLYHVGEVYGHPLTQCLALGLVPMIVMAQCFCWCGVVTLNHLYHAIEESIWAISSLFIGMAMAALVIYQPDKCLRVGGFGTVCCFSFFLFMVIVDVPMYVRRWREGKQNMMQSKEKKLIYMNMVEGSFDSMERRVVTKSWKVWKEETLWLTLYFSTANNGMKGRRAAKVCAALPPPMMHTDGLGMIILMLFLCALMGPQLSTQYCSQSYCSQSCARMEDGGWRGDGERKRRIVHLSLSRGSVLGT
eukprot:scaffold1523_cov162-Skeletonema_menzelii.AAC.2